jgi:hypothetical protein
MIWISRSSGPVVNGGPKDDMDRQNRRKTPRRIFRTPRHSPLCLQPRFEVEILDEYHLVALFVVDELIDEMLREQNAKTS